MSLDNIRIVRLLSGMSRLQKRVTLLLSQVSESGSMSRLEMEQRLPSGLLGELACAHRHDYVEQLSNGRFVITEKGKEVLLWVCGNRPNAPLHWQLVVRRSCKRQ